MAYIGHPLVDDNIYGEGDGSYKLHAGFLSFTHPYTDELIELKSDYII
jgi:23S rRNA-/tRNA-specific pseudouridylate synthase